MLLSSPSPQGLCSLPSAIALKSVRTSYQRLVGTSIDLILSE